MAAFARHWLIVAGGTACSRLLGLVRDMALAWLLGAGPLADAVTTALRLPFAVRRLFGEGVLSQELTARFVQARRAREGGDVTLLRGMTGIVAGAGLALLALCLPFAGCVVTVLAPGFSGEPGWLHQTAALFRICAGYLPAVLCAAVCMAFLHARSRFGAPSMTGSLFNLTVVGFCAVAALGVGNPGEMVAWGVLLGGLVQWGTLVPAVRAEIRREAVPPRSPAPGGSGMDGRLWTVARGLPVGIVCAALPQLVFLIAAGIVSLQAESSLAALFYAERLLEFPLGLIGSALGIAATTRLAELGTKQGAERIPEQSPGQDRGRQTHTGDEESLETTLRRVLELGLLFSLPATAGLLALAGPLVAVLFGRGSFDAAAVGLTASAVCAYAPGLPAYAASRPLLAACNTLHDRRTPLLAVVCGLALALAGGLVMTDWVGFAGAPLAASLGLWGYAGVLWLGVRGRMAGCAFPWSVCALGGAGSAVVYAAARAIAGWADTPLGGVALAVPCGVALYAALLLGSRVGRVRIAALLRF
jgi:Uncharacterized membrane protein, putative virulence factor